MVRRDHLDPVGCGRRHRPAARLVRRLLARRPPRRRRAGVGGLPLGAVTCCLERVTTADHPRTRPRWLEPARRRRSSAWRRRPATTSAAGMLGEAVDAASSDLAAAADDRTTALRFGGATSSWQRVQQARRVPPRPGAARAADPHRAAGAASCDAGRRRRPARLLRPRGRHRVPAARRVQPARDRRHRCAGDWPSRARPPRRATSWSSSRGAVVGDLVLFLEGDGPRHGRDRLGPQPGRAAGGASPPRRPPRWPTWPSSHYGVHRLVRRPRQPQRALPRPSRERLGMRREVDAAGRLLVQGRVDRLPALGDPPPTSGRAAYDLIGGWRTRVGPLESRPCPQPTAPTARSARSRP